MRSDVCEVRPRQPPEFGWLVNGQRHWIKEQTILISLFRDSRNLYAETPARKRDEPTIRHLVCIPRSSHSSDSFWRLSADVGRCVSAIRSVVLLCLLYCRRVGDRSRIIVRQQRLVVRLTRIGRL